MSYSHPSIRLFTYLLVKYLQNVYYIPGIVLGIGNITYDMKKTYKHAKKTYKHAKEQIITT